MIENVKNYVLTNRIKLLNFSILIFTTYLTSAWINLFYISTRNADFDKYYNYINFFLGADVNIEYGQGVLYYFLVTSVFQRNLKYVDEISLEYLLSNSIQNINLIFYLVGILGIYRLFKVLKFNENLIIFSLSILNFFPQAIYVRAVMKPEIIGFSFFPWILYFFERYKKDKNILNLFYAIPFFVMVFTAKGSIGGMVTVYCLFSYFFILKKPRQNAIYIVLITLVLSFSVIMYENYSITGNFLFEREYDEDYDNQANLKSIFNFNLKDIYLESQFNSSYTIGDKENVHANSILNSLILDSFGDFYNQLFNLDINYFSQNRKDLFTTDGDEIINKNRQILYNGPFYEVFDKNLNGVRRALSSTVSILFYAGLIYLIYKDKKYRKFYLLPFFGMLTLFVNSLGIPTNNYNPFLGDTYKVFYFNFFICITFLLVILKILSKLKYLRIFILIFWVLLTFFLAGHPKEVNQVFSEQLSLSNQYSFSCSLNNSIFFKNKIIKYFHESPLGNNAIADCDLKTGIFPLNDDRKRNTEFCFDNNSISQVSSRNSDCRLVYIDYLYVSGRDKPPVYPIFSIILIFTAFFIVVKNFKFRTKLLD